jgi:carboxyl-terminal processing protease
MMYIRTNTRGVLGYVLAAFLAMGAGLCSWATPAANAAAEAPATPNWGRVVSLVESGKFEDALTFLKESGADDETSRTVISWLEEFQTYQQERERLTREDYEKYVTRAQKRHEEALKLLAEGLSGTTPKRNTGSSSSQEDKIEEGEIRWNYDGEKIIIETSTHVPIGEIQKGGDVEIIFYGTDGDPDIEIDYEQKTEILRELRKQLDGSDTDGVEVAEELEESVEESLGTEKSEAEQLLEGAIERTEASLSKSDEAKTPDTPVSKFLWAIHNATLAMENSDDMEAFRQEAWVNKLRRDAVKEANTLREKALWLDAHAVYSDLLQIFEMDPELESAKRECLVHARLDLIFEDGSEWEEALVGIDPKMTDRAFWHISNRYYRDVNFRELALAGYEQVKWLAESKTAQKEFKGLAYDLDRNSFLDRLAGRMRAIRSANRFDRREAEQNFRRLLVINRQTVQLPESLVVREFTEGALSKLDDFTAMIWPNEEKEFEKNTEGSFPGVGISISKRDNEITVMSPLEDTPAYRAGIIRDDVITHVDGEELTGVTLTKAVQMITGPIDTHVVLTIRRKSEPAPFDVRLKRQRIEVRSAKGFERDPQDDQKWNWLIDPDYGIAYVRLTSFQKETETELHNALVEAIGQGAKGFILDLRFNPGGLLPSALHVSEMFLNRDDLIVFTKDRSQRREEHKATRNGSFRDLPMIVMVNEYSASASEIVSGCLKDWNRAIVLGDKTFGKFSVQVLMPLFSDQGKLKLTTANYYLPQGASLHRSPDAQEWGVRPTIEFPIVPKELSKILTMQRELDIIGRRSAVEDEDSEAVDEAEKPGDKEDDQDAEAEPAAEDESAAEDEPAAEDESAAEDDVEVVTPDDTEEPDRNNRPERDPQLEAAMLVLKIRLMDPPDVVVARQDRLEKQRHE